MRRLHPEPAASTSVLEAYDVVRARHQDGRPWVGLCMVASIDGATALHGRSRGLSNANDSEVLLTLRRLADVIVVGAGTARTEGYGPPSKDGQRIGVITNSGDLDYSSPLFASGAGFVIGPESLDVPDEIDTIRAGGNRLDLPVALTRLDDLVPGVTFVQAEGGPTLNGALLDHDLLDEINVTTSPQLAGGTGARLAATAREHGHRYDLAHLLIDDEAYVFSRWVRRPAC